MENTWASGSLELLNHAEAHMDEESAFDKRIAFISIDNSVEIAIRTFLGLPARHFLGTKPSRKEIEYTFNSFPSLLDLLIKYAANRLVGIDPIDIEFYHRLRNKLYHDGTGLATDDSHIFAYFTIAKLLLEKLFDIKYASTSHGKKPSPEDVLLLWNKIEKQLEELFYLAGIHDKGTYKWEEALSEKILTMDLISQLTELRMERNKLVHSNKKMTKKELGFVLKKAEDTWMALVNQVGRIEEMRNT
jgi:hypothetical protein